MKDNDVALISEQFGLTKEVVEASITDGTLGQRIKDSLGSKVVYSKDDFDAYTKNLKAQTTNEYFNDLVEKAKKGEVPQDIYNPVKGAAYQQLEREVSKKVGITEFNGISDLIDKIITSAKTSKGDPDTEKIINELKLANTTLLKEKEDAIKTVTNDFNQRFINKEKSALLNAVPFDFSNVKADELEKSKTKTQTLLKSVFDAEYELKYNDNNVLIVADKQGKVLTNPATLEPIPAKDVLINLAKEYNLKLTSPDSGGQGGQSSASSNAAFTDAESFYAYCRANNLDPHSREGLELLKKSGVKLI